MSDIVKDPFVIDKGTVQRGNRRVRAMSSGQLVVDSLEPLLVWEHSYYPQYFFAPGDVEVELRPKGTGPRSKVLGPSELFDVVVGDRVLPKAATRYPQMPVEAARDAYTLTWSALDTWLEEDEVVYFHPRSPYVRIDALPSTRHVVVKYKGEVIADSTRPVMLLETGLVPRYYLPRVDVRMDLLVPSREASHCPYKGTAHYWTIRTEAGELTGAVWGYATPLPEAAKLAGMVCFWPEKSADLEVIVEGERIGGQAG